MPDFAPDVTPRYIAKYHVASLEHSIMVRFARGSTELDNVSEAHIILHGAFEAVAALLAEDFVWTSAEYIPQDTNVSHPTSVPEAVTGAVTMDNFSIQDKISHLTISGRGSLGSSVHWQMYGMAFDTDTVDASPSKDFIFHAGENSLVDAAAGAFNRASIRTVDQTKPIIRGDKTYKVNDFWLKRARRGGVTEG